MRHLILALTVLALAPASPLRSAEPEHDTPAAAATEKPDIAALQDLLTRAIAASDPRERERLLAQHLAAMRRALDGLRAMDCAAPMSGMSGGMPMMQCHEAMTRRMATLIEIVDQMLAREDLEAARRKR